MVSLVDIAPATEKITVAGANVDVCGVSAHGIALVLGRFPEVQKLLAGQDVALTPEKIISIAPDAIAAIIAAGTGHPGEPDHEKAAANLPIEYQLDFMEAIIRVTMPKGIAPFVERLRALGLLDLASADGEGASGKVRDTKLQKPSKAS